MKTRSLAIIAVLLMTLLAGCACQPRSVLTDLPDRPLPKAPKEAMQPLPEPSHFQTMLQEIFDSSLRKPTP